MIANLNNSLHLFLKTQATIELYIPFLLKEYFLSLKYNFKLYQINEKIYSFWDEIFQEILNLPDHTFIITVNPKYSDDFKNYLSETQILKLLLSSQFNIYHHNIFTPGRIGEGVEDTLNSLLSNSKKEGKTIIWENDNLGKTLKEHTKGKFSRLKELPEFWAIKDDIYGIIYLPAENYYFQKDFSFFLCSGESFDDAIHKTENNIIMRSRLFRLKNRIFKTISAAGF